MRPCILLWPAPLAIVLSLSLPSAATRAETAEGRRFAVLVGINDYRHSSLPNLLYAENDVTELAELLKAARFEVTLMTGTAGAANPDLRPTRANIEARLHALLERCGKKDTVLVALAGHGLQFNGFADSFFCPVDARPFADEASRKTLLSLNEVYRQLEQNGAGVKLLLVDACRNDPNPARGRGLDGSNTPRPPRGVAALFSCSPGEKAFEHEEYRHGIFFHHVLEGLRGRAKDGEGDVTWDSLQNYVRKRVTADVPRLFRDETQQTPCLRAGDLAGIPPVLVERSAAGDADPVTTLRREAELGNADSQFSLAWRYANGEGVPKNYVEAAKWYRKAANQGHAVAQNNLGALYEDGDGVPQDYAEALKLYHKSAAQNEPFAQKNLGRMYSEGLGVKKNDVEAARWYQKAAVQGHAGAQCSLGVMYEEGRGVRQDDDEAVKWYRKAAEQGHARGQCFLAEMYGLGRGVPRDDAEAVRWFRKSAAQDDPRAQHRLGLAHLYRRGAVQDDAEAMLWFKKAAAQNEAIAFYAVGWMYENGRGVGENQAEAVRWYRKGAAAGSEDARSRLRDLGYGS
jgi:TPR repeat protein